MGGVGASCTLSQAPQHVPKGVPAQQVVFIGVCSLGDGGVDPVFESDHVFVAGGQDSRGDEDCRRCSIVFPVCSSSSVWCVMARPARSRSIWGAELLSSQRSACLAARSRPAPEEDFPVGRDGAGVVGEQFVQAPRDGAASAPAPVVERRVGRSSGNCARRCRAGCTTSTTARRLSAAQRSDLAATSAADPPLLHAKHQGLSVAFETTHAAVRPADRARQAPERGTHLPHSGPSSARTATRSTSTALDACFAVGGISAPAASVVKKKLFVFVPFECSGEVPTGTDAGLASCGQGVDDAADDLPT